MDWNRLEQLLAQAAALPEERRASFLHEAAGDAPDLLREALSLLNHLGPAEEYFSGLAPVVVGPASEEFQPSDRVGPYKLLDILGEGGMGRVWLAEQNEPVRRRVALKVIKLGMDTREVVARFESERQALAVMDHPGIARVFDGGMTEKGRPFFVMELVRGIPITEYCDTHRLTTAKRVRLFIQVCEAVQHAHIKGVIHRDLKPSNVLVVVRESGPSVKVIDFGVAKAVSGSLTDRTLATSLGQIIGTPAYMSPEQAEQSGLDVDSRTDVYALGVMLYELLAGVLPFDSEMLGKPALVFQFMLRDKDVPTPSARLRDVPDTQRTVATARRTDARTLRRELSGDLDWIVMRAMEKDRTRRYETASGLAQDLVRYLEHQPVVARPPTPAYKVRRFVRRNRIAVAGAVATVAALVFGVLGTSTGLVRARRAESVAQREAATAEAVSDFLASLFATQTPSQTLGRERSASEILELGAKRVRSELSDQPLVQAEVLEAIGDVYLRMQRESEAAPLLEESLAIREAELGPESVEAASTILVLARNASIDLDRRRVLLERALATFEREDGPGSIGAIRARQNLSSVLVASGDFSEAERLLLEAEDAIQALPQAVAIPEIEYQTPGALLGRFKGSKAALYAAQGRWAEETRMREEAVEILERELEPDNPYLASAYRDLAWRYLNSERNPEAVEMQERALASMELVFGPTSSQVAGVLITLGRAKQNLGRFDEAEAHYRRARDTNAAVFGRDSFAAAQSTVNLGLLELARGRPERAEGHFLEALPGYATDSTSETAFLYGRLADALERQGKMEEATSWAVRAVEAIHASNGWAHRAAMNHRSQLAGLYFGTGRPELAARMHLEATDTIEARYGPGSTEVGLQALHVAQFYEFHGQYDVALEWIERGVPILAQTDALYDDRVAALHAQARLLSTAGRYDEAIAAQDRLVSLIETRGDEGRWDLIVALQRYRDLYEGAGRPEEARPTHRRALELLQRHLQGAEDTTRLQFAAFAGASRGAGEFVAARRYHQRQLDKLSPGTDYFLLYMIAIRTGLEEVLHELDDVQGRLANFQAALTGFDNAEPHQRAVILERGPSVENLAGFLRGYEALLRELDRGLEADAVASRLESLGR